MWSKLWPLSWFALTPDLCPDHYLFLLIFGCPLFFLYTLKFPFVMSVFFTYLHQYLHPILDFALARFTDFRLFPDVLRSISIYSTRLSICLCQLLHLELVFLMDNCLLIGHTVFHANLSDLSLQFFPFITFLNLSFTLPKTTFFPFCQFPHVCTCCSVLSLITSLILSLMYIFTTTAPTFLLCSWTPLCYAPCQHRNSIPLLLDHTFYILEVCFCTIHSKHFHFIINVQNAFALKQFS